MAESKRTFQAAKIERDLDERLIQPGSYRDALNVSVASSEDANAGSLENLKGNEPVIAAFPSYLDSSSNIGVKVIGSIPHPEENKIYYFFTGSNTDGIVEYDNSVSPAVIKPIILDGTEKVIATQEKIFTFADASASGTISKDGIISLNAQKGIIISLTENFNEAVDVAKVRIIQVNVKVPIGYSNTGQWVSGTLEITQPSKGNPEVYLKAVTNISDTTATFNGYYTFNPGLTAIGFKYIANTSGSTSHTLPSDLFYAGIPQVYGRTVTFYDNTTRETSLLNVPASDITVEDKNGVVIPSSNYSISSESQNKPAILEFDEDYNIQDSLPTIAYQTSTATSTTTGVSQSHVETSGVDVPVTPIVANFKADITGLTPDTDYVVLAYATNSITTTYTPIAKFKTKVSSITLPTFSGSSAVAGTSLVTFRATPNSNGGDGSATLYVVSNEQNNDNIAAYKAAAYTLIGGGSAGGYTLSTLGSWTSGTQQSVSVSTTGGNFRKGLVFAKNSSPLQDGGDNAGFKFDTAFVQATANVPNVNGAASFSGTMSGPTGTVAAGQTLTFIWNGTSTVTTLPVGGHTGMHGQMTGSGLTWITSGVSGNPYNVNTVGGTSNWNITKTITGPTNPGTYTWNMRVFYDSNTQANGTVTGSFTVPAPAPTSGTFTLDATLRVGPNVGQTYGGGIGTGLLVAGNASSTQIAVGDRLRMTYSSGYFEIDITSVTYGSNSFFAYTLATGPGGLAFSSGTTIDWSQV